MERRGRLCTSVTSDARGVDGDDGSVDGVVDVEEYDVVVDGEPCVTLLVLCKSEPSVGARFDARIEVRVDGQLVEYVSMQL